MTDVCECELMFLLFVFQEATNATIKTVIEKTEQTRTDRANTEIRRSGNAAQSKFFTPIQQNVMSPTHK